VVLDGEYNLAIKCLETAQSFRVSEAINFLALEEDHKQAREFCPNNEMNMQETFLHECTNECLSSDRMLRVACHVSGDFL
jgi:hypothetical protein